MLSIPGEVLRCRESSLFLPGEGGGCMSSAGYMSTGLLKRSTTSVGWAVVFVELAGISSSACARLQEQAIVKI